MKNLKAFFIAILLLSVGVAQAKKVKFSVDMRGQVIDTAGIHVTGDFQDEAGYAGGDWITNTVMMTQEVSDTNIYSVVVDIPAFVHYEFKYVNGDQGYQQEFVPIESRVNYNFIDNRWIYVDSLSNDTQNLPAVRFGMNAPVSKNLIRLYVDMQNESSVNTNGVHVGGVSQSWDPAATRMFSFDGNVYEYLFYVDSGNVVTEREYKFLNGNTTGNYEALAGWCQNQNGNRAVIAPRDTMMPVVCYTFCDACSTAGIHESSVKKATALTPNPASDNITLSFPSTGVRQIEVFNVEGRSLMRFDAFAGDKMSMDVSGLAKGLYNARITDKNAGTTESIKFIVN